MAHIAVPDPVEQTRLALMSGDGVIRTPFGARPLVYADYAASGRGDSRIETRLAEIMDTYANPHTDDSFTGQASTGWLKRAEAMIKRAINARDEDVVLACGAGATAGIGKLQQILGLAEAPAARAARTEALRAVLGQAEAQRVENALYARTPVVFVGPYEHHSNELTWREGRAEVVRIGLNRAGGIDHQDLEKRLRNPSFDGRRKIGAFSAASNVTGVKTDVARLGRLLHAHDAILCLDCAASAPYLPIDMNPRDDPEAGPDAVYFSPHKFIGGPGACGVLAFKAPLYRRDLSPTLPGGGTVAYVTPESYDFLSDITARERAGTPGVLQLIRAALAFDTVEDVGYDIIEAREQTALKRAFGVWSKDPAIEILGPQEPEARIGIVSFNIRVGARQILHPRYVATLLNDLFGIQARAGCSCAGPYAHQLLNLDEDRTRACRAAVLDGYAGLRPGWCRLSLHWVMSLDEVDYIIEAVRIIAACGDRFLSLYLFDAHKGCWRTRSQDVKPGMISKYGGARLRDQSLADARAWAHRLGSAREDGVLDERVETLRDFPAPA